MRLLLDSHIFLWYARNPSPLHVRAQSAIEEAKDVFVSMASLWELAIKRSKGKLPESRPLADLVSVYNFQILQIQAVHCEQSGLLPMLHRDPFDHMLLAQAKVESLTLVTHDRTLGEYGVPVLLV